jgi:thiamine pyrophosphate-dependent acetolactate synthase large subunit-like protein
MAMSFLDPVMGGCATWKAAYWRLQTWHGSMANAMPPAIGAQEVLPD